MNVEINGESSAAIRSDRGGGKMVVDGGSLTAKNGGMFYTTNTESTITLSDVDITRIMSTYNNDKVLFQAHYVPTSQYTSPSFGDERLLPTDYWITLVKPDYYLLDNNGKDLYMFKTKPAPTRR